MSIYNTCKRQNHMLCLIKLMNELIIEKTASNLYKAKVNQSKEPAFKQPILNVTLDFLKLEELCKNFKRK